MNLAKKITGLLFFIWGPVFAVETASNVQAPAQNMIEPMSFSSVAQVFAGLVAVLLLFGLVVFVLKRLGGFKTTSAGKMRVVDGLSVGTRERVLLMQVGEKQILLGVTPHQINPLHVFDEAVIEPDQAPQGFSSLLQNQIKKRVEKSGVISSEDTGS